MEFRIRKLEELNEQTLSHLGVIHRFMATHMSNEGLQSFDVEFRPRRVSERSEAFSEVDSQSQLPSAPLRRKKLLRSLTDATFMQNIPPIDDDVLKQSEARVFRENLSRNDSSVSGDQPPGQVDRKMVMTSQDESDENKPVGEEKSIIKKESQEEKASSEIRTSGSRQNSGEKISRQNSRTRSESEDMMYLTTPGTQRGVTWGEPRVSVIQPSNPRSLMLAMRAEYTSITDELETYCGLLSPPRSPPVSPPPGRGRTMSGLSNSEMAWHVENEHLRDAEECDYQQMEDLIQR